MKKEEARQILAGLYALNIDGDADYCERRNTAIDIAIEAMKESETKQNLQSIVNSQAKSLDTYGRVFNLLTAENKKLRERIKSLEAENDESR